MAEAVSSKTELADSLNRTRPHFQTVMMTDANAGGHIVDQIEEKRRIRQMKFPKLVGRHDWDSFQCDVNKEKAFKKWNDEGDYRDDVPNRFLDSYIDSVSGFVSVGGEVDRNTGSLQIRSMVQLPRTPHSTRPQDINSIRMEPQAPQELRRNETLADAPPPRWNSKKISDRMIRSRFGGWTSDYDPRKPSPKEVQIADQFIPKPPSYGSKLSRDQLAMKYVYTSSTERSYNEVPWDEMLPPKEYTPVTTLEARPDNISHRLTFPKKYNKAQDWQLVGHSWDMVQNRRGYYRGPPVNYCSPCPRKQQIPLYGGCIGAENLDEIDDRTKPFTPFTIKRSVMPHPSDTAHRPNIPGYTGCTLWQGVYMPAHLANIDPATATTFATHRSVPIPANDSGFKRDSQMSKMVTTVPPCNPFNGVSKEYLTSN